MKRVLLLFFIMLFAIPLLAQQEHETKSEIKELTEFHDVIYQIWHTAWPEKNVDLLKSLLPDVEKGFSKIKAAQLPGILRDKKEKWNEGLKKFEASVNAYKEAATKNDAQTFLNAAEKLHSDYEALVRVIKPMVKEMDAFHQDLYLLYHYYNPEFNYDKIVSTVESLNLKMNDLMNVKLSKKLEAKQEKFDAAKESLKDALDELTIVVKKGKDKEAIDKAVDKTHSKYEELEKIFD
jgi:hypothetical protein